MMVTLQEEKPELLGKWSVWNVQVDSNDSWGWKTMMRIRDKIKDHVLYEIGKGNTVSIWYDKWSSNGPLGNFISQMNIHDAKISIDAIIPDVIKENRWIWPNEWLSKFPELQCISTPPALNDKEDKVVWVTNAGHKVCFSIKQAWMDMRDEMHVVAWKNVVWFKQLIRKHGLILRLPIQGKLLTQDKIEK
ncbi:hypothetical protein Tco_1432007 [Tanacetum coccineum]